MSTAREMITRFSDVHTLPHVVTQLTSLINNSDSTIKQFEEVIQMDPVLVARLLRYVNSPLYGLVQRVDSIGRAVAYLGMKNLHSIAVTQALKDIFQANENSQGFSREKLWLHSAAVSICAKMIAERIFGINGDDSYLTGILHDFGLIVLEQVHTTEFYAMCAECATTTEMLAAESMHFASNHCEIGYLVTQDWSMPAAIQEAIRDHHEIFATLEPQSLTGILQLAEYLTAQQGYSPLPAMNMAISPPLLDHLEENSDEYEVLMEDFPEEMAKAKTLYS